MLRQDIAQAIGDNTEKLSYYAYLALPLALWPLSFIVLRSSFIYAMCASTFVLASFSLIRYRGRIKWGTLSPSSLAAGVVGAVVLYLLFLFGYVAAPLVGLSGSVAGAFGMIYAANTKAELVFLLALIGVFEEIYWRGGIQGIASGKGGLMGRMPWAAAAAYYTLVHISTLNPILVIAALFVGLMTSLIAHKYGIIASTLTHILWIEAIIVFLPLTALAL